MATQIFSKIPTQVQANPVCQQNAYLSTSQYQQTAPIFTTSVFSGISVDNVKPQSTLTNAVATKVNKKLWASILLSVNPSSEQQYLELGVGMRKDKSISINNIPLKKVPDNGSKTVSCPLNATKPTTVTSLFNRGFSQIDLDHLSL